MRITCNGEEYTVEEGKRISDFIQELGLAADTLVVEYNDRILSKEERETMILGEGATLELIRFVGGGSRSC